MTNSVAIWLALCIFIALMADIFAYDSENLLFLSKKGLALVEWLAFWR